MKGGRKGILRRTVELINRQAKFSISNEDYEYELKIYQRSKIYFSNFYDVIN